MTTRSKTALQPLYLSAFCKDHALSCIICMQKLIDDGSSINSGNGDNCDNGSDACCFKLSCECNALFCKHCIVRYLQYGSSNDNTHCPLCREPIQRVFMVVDDVTQRTKYDQNPKYVVGIKHRRQTFAMLMQITDKFERFHREVCEFLELTGRKYVKLVYKGKVLNKNSDVDAIIRGGGMVQVIGGEPIDPHRASAT